MRSFLKRTLLAGTVLLLVGMGLYLTPLSPPFMARQLSQQAEYFFADEERWVKEHTLAEVLWIKLLEFKLRHDLQQVLDERLSLSAAEPASSLHRATAEVQALFITQQQGEVPIISTSTLASFVRGYGYCDQINGFLALLLSSHLDQVALVGINEPGKRAHSLVKTQSDLGTVWVDAFSCLPAFGFEEELSEAGKLQIPRYDRQHPELFPEASYQQGVAFNQFGMRYTVQKAFNRFSNLFKQKTTHPEQVVVSSVQGVALAQNKKTQQGWRNQLQQESPESKQHFIMARMLHLYGLEQEAGAYYKKVVAAGPKGPLARYSTHFLQRLSGRELPCTAPQAL